MGYSNGFSVDGYATPEATQTVSSNASVGVDADVIRMPVQASDVSINADADVYIIGTTAPAASLASDANVYIQPVTVPAASVASDVNMTAQILSAKFRRWNGSFWERIPTTYVWNGTSWSPVL